jgi:26S proteasome regulatory subunit N10
MTLIGRKLKKNNVAIDIISYGNVDENAAHLKSLLDSINNNNNSHILEVLPGFYLVDSLFSSPIINSEMEGFDMPVEQNNVPSQSQPTNVAAGGQGVGMSQFEKDINLAIQNSLLEEQRNKEEESKKNQQQSMNIASKEIPAGTPQQTGGGEETIEENENEEEELEKARLLSMQVHEENIKNKKEKDEKEKDQFLNNEDFIKDVLKEINSGDIDDSLVKDVMNKLKNDEEKKKSEQKPNENTPGDQNKKDG